MHLATRPSLPGDHKFQTPARPQDSDRRLAWPPVQGWPRLPLHALAPALDGPLQRSAVVQHAQ
eukprot:7427111-Lingulodinium_polyedra.AAC.1